MFSKAKDPQQAAPLKDKDKGNLPYSSPFKIWSLLI